MSKRAEAIHEMSIRRRHRNVPERLLSDKVRDHVNESKHESFDLGRHWG